MNQSIAALIAIATVIPLAMIATLNTDKPSAPMATAGGNNDNNNNSGTAASNKIKVAASFYPLSDFVRNIGGSRVDVFTLVPNGMEPHDWDPTPNQILDTKSSDVFIYNGAGLEPWVDKIDAKIKLDTSNGLQLLNIDGMPDPHIWLDPVLVKHQVQLILDTLVEIDPSSADYYAQNAKEYLSKLDSLDAFIRSEFANCDKADFIAFHDAFSYFAKRYGLVQYSLLGVGAEQEELSPEKIGDVINLARELQIDTIYSEELVDPRLANVIAGEISNGKVLVLSPVESLTEEERQQKSGFGYIEKMMQNVANLKEGLDCK
jgi:zinc transport system substrate-binding protein